MKKRIANAKKIQWVKIDLTVPVRGTRLVRLLAANESIEASDLSAEQPHESTLGADDSQDGNR